VKVLKYHDSNEIHLTKWEKKKAVKALFIIQKISVIKLNTCRYIQRTPPQVRVPPPTLNVPYPIAFIYATAAIRRVSAMITLQPSISASRHHSRQLNDSSTLSTLIFFFIYSTSILSFISISISISSSQLYMWICDHLRIKLFSAHPFLFSVVFFFFSP